MTINITKANPLIGPGGAPTRTTTLPDDPKSRKQYPVASGVVDYFPDALVEISRVSWNGNEQHNPGQSLRWDRSKSSDESDTIMRHFMQRGTIDTDGMRHSAKLAWRALALLQKEIEEEQRVIRTEIEAPPQESETPNGVMPPQDEFAIPHCPCELCRLPSRDK